VSIPLTCSGADVHSQSARSKHKASRRRATGRKGTVDEYEYLLASIGRLVTRVEEKSGKLYIQRLHRTWLIVLTAEALRLLRHLIIASPSHRDLALSLQGTIITLRDKLSESIREAWRERDIILNEASESGGMALNGDVQKAREIERPVVVSWKGLGVLAR
jgi:elongator complex protein 1